MRKITSHRELAELMDDKKGYLVNERGDRKMLHRISCEAVEVMSHRAYDKYFFTDFQEARDWLDQRYGRNGWEVCGRCG
jgi:hypothetical protein